ncbi:hypothetical protein KZ288_29775, partial [Escherichia coli]|uniref:hypothetical protein n=1 Tax=Escherichia coli TaxID=562 RepID=UPI001ED9E341
WLEARCEFLSFSSVGYKRRNFVVISFCLQRPEKTAFSGPVQVSEYSCLAFRQYQSPEVAWISHAH